MGDFFLQKYNVCGDVIYSIRLPPTRALFSSKCQYRPSSSISNNNNLKEEKRWNESIETSLIFAHYLRYCFHCALLDIGRIIVICTRVRSGCWTGLLWLRSRCTHDVNPAKGLHGSFCICSVWWFVNLACTVNETRVFRVTVGKMN